ncbi:MAG: amino acid adenylation domain-containing protein, partial [Polyangiaceae bacterium]|nr:amino acid adenylation domain-containing protein [Polyangiaceae bacterium]
MALLAAFQALLARYAGINDVSIGTPVAGRTRLEFEGLVGLFVNTLVLRTRLEPERSFRALLGRTRETCLEAFAHQELPFERLVEALRPERDRGGTPLFRAFFSLQNTPRAAVTLSGLAFAPIALPIAAAKFDLSLRLEEREGAFVGALDYRADLFEPSTAERLARHLEALLASAVASPERPLGGLPLLDDHERKHLLEAGSGGLRAGWGTLGEALSARAAERPRALALAYHGSELSFAELERRSNQIGRALRRRGVGPGTAVGVCLPRSLELVVGIWGVLKAGGAYVPLDPSYPPARLELMARDARIRLALCTRQSAALVAGAETLALDEGAPGWAEAGEPLPSGASPEGLAYILYTSGSTGQPKGVAVRQGAVCNLIAALRGPLGLHGRTLRFSLNGSVSFDTSVKQIFQALEGHALDVTPEEVRYDVDALLEYLERQRIEGFDCTPTHLRPLLAAGLARRARPGLKVLVGGEPIDEALWAELAAANGDESLEFFNLYGPTECTVDASVARVRDWPRPALGLPLAGVRLYALDERGGLAPPGAPAELYVGGVGVARGYFEGPAPTAERFVPDPFAAAIGARMYRTGDRVRRWPDGRIEHLGRVDQQLKVRGIRVELGEIEAALHALPGVRRAAAASRDGRLVAYVEAPAGFDVAASEQKIRATLPDALVPSAFVAITDWPLSPSGKLDRARLPVPPPTSHAYVAPRTPSERALAALWQDVLGRERVGVHDHFFELGGHSLLATQVLARLRSALGVELPLRALFEAPTLAALAARLDAAPPGVAETPLRRRGASLFVAPLSPAQERLWFLQRLAPSSPAYHVPFALRLEGALDRDALAAALEALA